MKVVLFAISAFLLKISSAITPPGASLGDKQPHDEELFTFEDFVQAYGKPYDSQEDYDFRRGIFEANLKKIVEHNQAKKKDSSSKKGGYLLGVNAFADLEPHELPKGYDKAQAKAMTALSSPRSLASLPFEIEPVSALPKAVDWREVATPVKWQGICGSCWAFASTAVLESHIALATGYLFSLSMQEMVSCAPNPKDCGGQGGCTGSIPEIAFEHVMKHGIVQEWNFGYQSFDGDKIACSLEQKQDSPFYNNAVASIDGFVSLENNSYEAIMNAVAKLGPLTVSVAAHQWQLYKSGVFDAPFDAADPKTTDIDHLVVLEGYGTDEETGEDYWLVRNSHGILWGESGYIRLKRVDPSTLDDPDSICGLDVTPTNGNACSKDDEGHDVSPPAEKVCGTSGILYSAAVPLGAHLIQ